MTACAFVVGIDEYPDTAGMPALKGAVADAVDFAEWALDGAGGAVAPQDMYFWSWPPPADAPSRIAAHLAAPTAWPVGNPAAGAPDGAAIVQSIFEIMCQAEARGLTRVFVFLAGHGMEIDRQITAEPPETCFMAGDFRPRFAHGLIPCDALQQALLRFGTAELVLLFDCCRTDINPTLERPWLGWPNAIADRNEWVAAGRAAKSKQMALEIETDSGFRGAFSHLVTFALRHLRFDDALTSQQLENYVLRRISKVIVPPRRQTPEFDIRPREPDFILVAGAPPPPHLSVSISFSGANQGRNAYLRDAELQVIATMEPAPVEWSSLLPLGTYSLEFNDGVSEAIAISHLGPGNEHVVV